MIPGFIVAVVGLCGSVFTLVVVPIIGLFFHDWLQQFMDERLGKDIPVNATGLLLYYWFFALIAAGLLCITFLFFNTLFQLIIMSSEFPFHSSDSVACCIRYILVTEIDDRNPT